MVILSRLRASQRTACLVFVFWVVALSTLAWGQASRPGDGIELPTVTITGQAKYLIMPQQPPVVREELRLSEVGATLLPNVHRLRTFPSVSLRPSLSTPQSGGCLFGSALGASVSMVFAKQRSLFRYALALYDKGRLSESDLRLKRFLEKYPRSEYAPEALFFRAQIALVQKRFEPASDLFRDLIARFPNYAMRRDALCNLAYAHYKMEDVQGCIEALSELLRDYPDSAKAVDARHARAALRFKVGEFAAAAGDFKFLSDLASGADLQSEYTFWRLESLYRAGRYREVLNLCKANAKSFESSKTQPYFLYVWASALKSLDRDEEAIELFGKVSEAFPESDVAAPAIFARGQMHRDAGILNLAQEAFEDVALRYRDTSYYCPALLNLGSARLVMGQLEAAKDALIQAEQTCTVDADLLSRVSYHLGLVSASRDRADEALRHFGRAYDKARDDDVKAAACLGQGWSDFVSGQYRPAASFFDKALSLRPPESIKFESLFWAGQSRLKLGQPKQAQRSFQELADALNDGADLLLDAHLGLGFASFLQEHWEAALGHFQLVATSDRDEDDRALSWLRMAQCAYYLGRYELGVEHSGMAEELTELEPILCGAAYVKGKCQLRLGQKQEALKLLGSLPEQFPDCDYLDDAKYAIASARFEGNEFNESIEAFGGLLSAFPDSSLAPKALLGIANSYYNTGDYESAATYYGKTLGSKAEDVDKKSALYGLVLCYQRQGLLSELETRIEEFIKRFKGQRMAGTLRALLAEEMTERKQYFGAIRQYNQAFYSLEQAGANEDELAKILYRIGQIMELTGDKKGAISEYDQLIVRFKGNRFAWMARLRKAHLYARLKETKKAIRTYSKLVKDHPDDADIAGVALFKKAELIRKKDQKMSLDLCNQVVSRFGDSTVAASALILSGEILIERGRFADARAKLDRAEKTGPPPGKKAYVSYLLGHSFFVEGNFKEASAALMRVRYLYPTSPWAAKSLLQAGKSLLKLEQPGEARKVLKAIQRDYPDDEEVVNQARAALKALPTSD